MLKTVSFAVETQPSTRLLILGAVHGDEKCGTVAIKRVIEEIENGDIILARGQVTFVPISNPRAYEADIRFVERNLNRFLIPMEKPDCYEAQIGNILCPILEKCDVLLDLHSYTVGGPAFVFVGQEDAKGQEFAANLGAHSLMTGWAAAYAASGRDVKKSADESTGTTEYARRFGATAVTLECGQHKDPHAPEIAYQAIRNALRYLGLTNEPTLEKKTAASAQLVTVKRVFYREDMGSHVKAWKHLDTIAKGETIATRTDGTPITAPDNGYIILPHADCPVGQEWFYFGTS